MMQIVVEGIGIGLALAMLLGPIFVALTQTGMQYGFRAGIMVGAGIWVSDIIIISSCWSFLHSIRVLTQNQGFQLVLGIAGSLILFLSGIFTLFSNKKTEISNFTFRSVSPSALFVKGFAVNTVNPFTFIFWIGIITSYLQTESRTDDRLTLLLASIMGTVIVTDSLKVMLARYIRTVMEPRHQKTFIRVSGLALMLFGGILLLRVLL
jgi:threonine/homoserine/homoserine lactone efflux protein